MRQLLLTFSLLAGIFMHCHAGEPDSPIRPVFAAYTFEAGSAHIADTYLTPSSTMASISE